MGLGLGENVVVWPRLSATQAEAVRHVGSGQASFFDAQRAKARGPKG